MNEPRRHYAKWDTPVTEGHVLHDATCEVPKTVKITESEWNVGCQGLGEGERVTKGY